MSEPVEIGANKHHWDGTRAKTARRDLAPVVFFSYRLDKFVRCEQGRVAEVVA